MLDKYVFACAQKVVDLAVSKGMNSTIKKYVVTPVQKSARVPLGSCRAMNTHMLIPVGLIAAVGWEAFCSGGAR